MTRTATSATELLCWTQLKTNSTKKVHKLKQRKLLVLNSKLLKSELLQKQRPKPQEKQEKEKQLD